MTGVGENWLAGRLTGALNLGREEAGKERKAWAGTTEDGEKICAFYARGQGADGGCSFMDANGGLQLRSPHEFGRVDKEKARRRGGSEAKVAGKRPSEGSDSGMNEGAGPARRRGRRGREKGCGSRRRRRKEKHVRRKRLGNGPGGSRSTGVGAGR